MANHDHDHDAHDHSHDHDAHDHAHDHGHRMSQDGTTWQAMRAYLPHLRKVLEQRR